MKLRFGGVSGDWLQAQELKGPGLQWGGLRVLREATARRIGLDAATVAAECAELLQESIEAVHRKTIGRGTLHFLTQ